MDTKMIFFLLFSYFTSIFSYQPANWVNIRQNFNPSELYFVVETVEYANEIFQSAELMNQIIILWVTYEHELDPYLKLYMEYVLELMKHTKSINVILHSSTKDIHLIPNVLKILPEKTIYIIVDDADLRLNVCTLYVVSQLLTDTAPVIFHLNHEMPWTTTSIGVTSEGETCTSLNLPNIYQNYKYVFRNYYHSSFLQTSEYIPLLTKQQRKLQEFRKKNPLIPSSKRIHWCIFSGRITYNHMRIVDSIFHKERNDFLNLLTSTTLTTKQCQAYYNNNGVDGHQHTFDEYVTIVSQTVFTPCPAGNNPETFRHYEALELGSIPLIIRQESDYDFLQEWKGYPGPIFQNWEEAFQFTSNILPSEVDNLQEKIMIWYEKFREDVSYQFSTRVMELFEVSPNSPKKIIHPLDIIKTNAPTPAAIKLLQTAKEKSTSTSTISSNLHSSLNKLTIEIQELKEQQKKMLNMLIQLINKQE